jgi:hypothetical protein
MPSMGFYENGSPAIRLANFFKSNFLAIDTNGAAAVNECTMRNRNFQHEQHLHGHRNEKL